MRAPLLMITASLLAATLGSAQAQQGVSLATGLTDFTTWTLMGSATAGNQTPGNGFTYSILRLTAVGIGGQAGAGFAPAALTIDFNQAFSFDFHFFIPANSDRRGDGLTFTLASTPGVGGGGSGLGYGGLAGSSLAFAVDTFHFGGEPISPSLQILQSGSVTPLATTETGLGDTIRTSIYQWRARVDFTPSGLGDQRGMLLGRIGNLEFGSFSVAAEVDFDALGLAGAPVFYGFTAGNGAASDGHWITSAVPVPEPQTWALMLAGLGLLGRLAGRRSLAQA